jgi:hypothetical protein
VVGIVVQLSFLSRPVCLPVLARLWRPRHTGKIAYARQLAELIAARYPDRTVHVVGDAAYVGEHLRTLDGRITWTSRLKVTSVLHELGVPALVRVSTAPMSSHNPEPSAPARPCGRRCPGLLRRTIRWCRSISGTGSWNARWPRPLSEPGSGGNPPELASAAGSAPTRCGTPGRGNPHPTLRTRRTTMIEM